jgi:DNA repair exonuclease SbcCD ATPase subunit
MSREHDPDETVDDLLARRLSELEEHAARFEDAMRDLERREQLLRDMRTSVERQLRLRSTDLTSHDAELEETRRELGEREARLRDEEAELARRRSELGAVELKREAVERRERALEAREAEIEIEAAQPAEEEPVAAEIASTDRAETADASVELLFVPGAGYRLVETEPRALAAGDEVELEDGAYAVARTAPSPLPGDRRRCAYLVRGVRSRPGSEGSS